MVSTAIITRIKDAEEHLEKSGGLNFNKYGLGPWSPSKVKMLEKCPYQFYLKYVLKVKPDDDYVQDTSMADVGTIAHRILEHVVLGKGVDDAYKATKFEHCEVPPAYVKKGHANITGEKWRESIEVLEGNIITFAERMDVFARNNKIIARHTELKLGVTKDWKKTTFFANDVYFRGIVDLAIEIETEPGYRPDFLVIDHKHGGGEFGAPSTRNYQQQLDSYKPMIHYGFKASSGIQAGINFVKAGTSAYDEYTSAEEIETTVRKRVEWIIQGAVDTTSERGFFKHIRGSHCVYCEFNDQCKPGMLKENELSTKKYFEIKEVKNE
jgi:hypothetical protein